MPRSWKLLGISVLILVSGLALYATSTVRETSTSRWVSTSNGPLYETYFTYSHYRANNDNPPQIIIGTTGIADVIILKVPFREFNDWVCHQGGYDMYIGNCTTFGGGDINTTILISYLQTHQSQIAYSQTIANENVTIDHRLIPVTDGTIVLAPVASGIYYWQTSQSNQTVTYPLIGYHDRPGVMWSPENISLGVIAAGTVGLLLTMVQIKPHPGYGREENRPYQGQNVQRCPSCGHESLFFARKCGHCGIALHNQAPEMEA